MYSDADEELMELAYEILKEEGPYPLSLAEITEEIRERNSDLNKPDMVTREDTRLALRQLFRNSHVSEMGDWQYRVTYPTKDTLELSR